MQRFTTLPSTLYRLQNTKKVKIRPYTDGKAIYDFRPVNELYVPYIGDTFEYPNGLSLRPAGMNLYETALSVNAKYVYVLEKVIVITPNFVLIWEHTDHYSLQTTIPIEPKQFCSEVDKFFKTQKIITKD